MRILAKYASHVKVFIVLYVTRGSVIFADCIVLVTTWYNTYRGRWRDVLALDVPASLESCLLRDGMSHE